MLITSVFGNIVVDCSSLSIYMHYFLQLMPYLKVLALPHPRKAAIDHQTTIITNRYVITSIEQLIVIAHAKFCWPTVKNIVVILVVHKRMSIYNLRRFDWSKLQ